jgi:hypothetical protein
MTRKSTRKIIRDAASLSACLALAVFVGGCRIHVDKDANGESKNVQVDTPFGGVHVNTDQTTAADLGLPVYPGAEVIKDDEKNKSADVHMGFAGWEFRVKVVNYATSDSREKVVAFYKKALGRYGDVIVCQNNSAVGGPTVTAEGLTCADDVKHAKVQINDGDFTSNSGGFELKAGSKHHQHIVGFEDPKDSQTRFALVALDLPISVDGNAGKSD